MLTLNKHHQFLFSYTDLFTVERWMIKTLQILPNWLKNLCNSCWYEIPTDTFIETIFRQEEENLLISVLMKKSHKTKNK